MLDHLKNLDQRWIYAAMFVAVAIPTLVGKTMPEKPSPLVYDAFRAIDDLPEGSNILLAFDYDPAGKGELAPMASAFVHHCCIKKHKIYFMALWPVGPRFIEDRINSIIKPIYPDYKYGVNYVNLGYKEGREVVMRVIVSNLKGQFPTDHSGTNLNDIPMTKNIKSIKEMSLIVDICAGTPGTKEWVQYVGTPENIPIVSGCTGVQAPLFYPYLPYPLVGMLPAIKGAAEYEAALREKYPWLKEKRYHLDEAAKRMGPQLVAHLLVVGLILLGNIAYFLDKRR